MGIGKQPGTPDHSDADIDRALDAWIEHGSSETAARVLESEGLKIAARTIRSFRAKRPQRYAELCRADLRAREVEAAAVKDARRSVASQVAALAARLEREQDADIRAQIVGEMDGLTRTQERLDKMGRLEAGTPTEITQDRSPADIDRELAQLCDEVEAQRG